MVKIYVESEEEKQKIINESEYIHDFIEIIKIKDKQGNIKRKYIGLDSDKANCLMHIYMNPDMIIVRPNKIK